MVTKHLPGEAGTEGRGYGDGDQIVPFEDSAPLGSQAGQRSDAQGAQLVRLAMAGMVGARADSTGPAIAGGA